MPIYLSYLSICLSISIYIYLYLSIYLYKSISIYTYLYLSICLSICLSFFLSIYLSIYLSIIYLSFFLSIYLSTYLSIYLFHISHPHEIRLNLIETSKEYAGFIPLPTPPACYRGSRETVRPWWAGYGDCGPPHRQHLERRGEAFRSTSGYEPFWQKDVENPWLFPKWSANPKGGTPPIDKSSSSLFITNNH